MAHRLGKRAFGASTQDALPQLPKKYGRTGEFAKHRASTPETLGLRSKRVLFLKHVYRVNVDQVEILP